VFDLGRLTLQHFDGIFLEGGQDRKRAGQPFLAEPAVAHRADNRVAVDPVPHGAADTISEVGIVHGASCIDEDKG
jgi:hypothetical protein